MPSWNAITLLDETVAGICSRWNGPRPDGQTETVTSIRLAAPRPPRYVKKAFGRVGTSDYRRFPGPLEILLVPQVAVAVLVHASIEPPRGYAVPLGLVGFDEAVLRRVEQYMLDNLGAYLADENLCREVSYAVAVRKA